MKELIDSIRKKFSSPQGQEIFKSQTDQHLASPGLKLLDFGIRKRPSVLSQSPSNNEISSKTQSIFRNTKISLEVIHQEKKRKSNILFFMSVLFAGIAVGIPILLLLWSILMGKDKLMEQSTTALNTIATIIPALLSGTLFILNREATKNLQLVEKDILMLNKLEGLLSILDQVEEEELRNTLLQKAIETSKP